MLLLDEPFGALDAKVRRDLRRWLREVHDRTGHTILFVTHDQEEALELAHRVAIFNRGRVEQVGTPDEVLDQPATPFVAGFVGEAVRLPVDAAGRFIRLGPHAIPTADDNIAGPAELFVRPRDFALAEAPRMRSRPACSRCAAPGPRGAPSWCWPKACRPSRSSCRSIAPSPGATSCRSASPRSGCSPDSGYRCRPSTGSIGSR